MDVLPLVRDHARLDEVDDAVGEHLGVDAEVDLVEQAREDGVGNGADAHLECSAVGDEGRDVRRDRGLDGVGIRRRVIGHRPVRVDEGGDGAERHDRVAVRARHLLVDLRNDQRGGAGRGDGGVGRGADGAEAVFVRRRELQDGGIELHAAAEEHLRDVGEEDRCEVGAAGLDRLAHVCADEERIRTEMSVAILGERGVAFEVDVVDANVFDVVALDQRVEERPRCGRGAVKEHAHPALDQLHCVFGRFCPVFPVVHSYVLSPES